MPTPYNKTVPAVASFEITPDDDNDLPVIPRQVRFNAGGTVAFHLLQDAPEDDPRTMTVIAGELISWRFRRIFDTGTEATGILGVH